MKNKILEKRAALEAALSTIDYQIKTLRQHVSREQLRCWHIRRNRIVWVLNHIPTEAMIQAGAKRINFSNSSKIKKNETRKMS